MALQDEGTVAGLGWEGVRLLSPELREKILETQNECTLIWVTQDGSPAGTIVDFLWHKGSIWLVGVEAMNARNKAIRRNPNVCVVVSVKGTELGRARCISIRGKCTIHDDDKALREEIIPLWNRKLGPNNVEERIEMAMSMPGLACFEIKPERLFTADYNDYVTKALGLEESESS